MQGETMKHLTVILPVVLLLLSTKANAKSLLDNCVDNKLKEYKTKNMVTIAEEPALIRKLRAECAKYTFTTSAEKQALAAEAQAADRQAKADKEAKDKAAAAAKPPAPTAKPTPVAAPAPAPTSSPGAAPAATSAAGADPGFTFGPCGSPAECAALMKEATTPKYTWSSPGLQAYMGELWGNNMSYAHGLGGTFEQPENSCKESNQGQIIGLDIGTEVVAVACMSSMATQEEIKAMAAKIKTIKVETLVPTVIAIKRPKYEWKVIVEPKRSEGQMCFCTHPGSCHAENLGREFSEHSCCGTVKCIRIDGGPVKPKSEKSKPAETAKPAEATPAAGTVPAAAPAPTPPPPSGYDPERDGSAGSP